MGKESTRRAFLTTVGAAGVVSLAGCSSLPGGGGGSEPATPGKTDNGTPTGTPTGTGTGTSGGGNGGNNAPGKSIDDFSSVKDWQPNEGKLKTTSDDVFQGKQSVSLQPKKGNIAKITKTFYSDSGGDNTIDLSKHDLSIAAKIKKPDVKTNQSRVKIAVNIIAPAESAMVTSKRQFPRDLDGWVRFDLGYTGKNGNPKLNKVTRIEIQVGPMPDHKNFKVLVDDIRKVPKGKKGKVMLQFDDGFFTTHTNAFPMLKERGWPASTAVIPGAPANDEYVSWKNLRELGDAGWDIMAHLSRPLTDFSPKKQKRKLQQAKLTLETQGFKQGAQHIAVPYHRMNKAALKNIDDLFETAYVQGGCPNNAKFPSNPSFISRVNGESVRGSRQIIDMASQFNQLGVLYFHEVGDGKGWLPKKDFKKILDHIEKRNVDVITPSQLVKNK